MTLLEVTLAIALMGIIVLTAGNLLIYSANTGNKHAAVQEVVENGRISLDFIIGQIRLADEIRPRIHATGILVRLEIYMTYRRADPYVISFDPFARRLSYGGQELASDIDNVLAVMDLDKQMLYITVISSRDGEDFSVTGGVDIQYKKIR